MWPGTEGVGSEAGDGGGGECGRGLRGWGVRPGTEGVGSVAGD